MAIIKKRTIRPDEESENEFQQRFVIEQNQVQSDTTFEADESSRPTMLTEMDLVMDALSLKVRGTTMLAYRAPLAHWKQWCDDNRYRFPIDSQYPYTVGPTEFVMAFFQEFVFKRTYNKSILMDTDVRTQIGLRSEQSEGSSMTLYDCNVSFTYCWNIDHN
ncbi:hypothetical protein [Parasitella parasitica]|uniref:Ndc10 domain-containing protein n=1 Tax=Parasitella parasitica TaxID=35722 RepID=A0A0B7NFR9_9FUNG|nr:hypothetical protein [Parasitella parasitica]